MQKVLKQDVLDDLFSDGSLLELVAKATRREMKTVLRLASPTDNKLLHIDVLTAIANYKNTTVDELVEIREPIAA